MNNNIFFSVMICCYNSEQYLTETIDSIINQTFTNWEIVAVNDGSSDNTEEIIKNYIEKGIPIIYHYQENAGFANARNKAISLSSGDWVAIIDHDDICLPERLEKQANDIQNNQDCSLFLGDSIHFTNNGIEVRKQFEKINPYVFDLTAGNARDMLLKYGCFIDSETVVFYKNDAYAIGGFNENYKFITDYDFFLRMAAKYNLYCSPELLSKWRIHENQATNTLKNDAYIELIDLFKTYIQKNNLNLYLKSNLLFKLIKMFIKKYVRL